MIGKSIGHFTIIRKLGSGGMGSVYLARDEKLERNVAIKFVSDQFGDTDARRRFEREARAIAALNHPNILTIYELGEHDGAPFIVLEYIDGKTLDTILADGPLSKEAALSIANDVARGLAAAYRNGVIHRDIKPSNIMVASDGCAKILDFGLAKLLTSSKYTQTKITLGTLNYLSPEQVSGNEIDGRSDLFSLGVTLYEMLTCKRPFSGEYEAAILYSIVNEDPAPLPTELRALQPVIDRVLAKNPDERYQSAEELLTDLEAALADKPVTAPKRNRILSYVLALVPILAVIALWLTRGIRPDGDSGRAREATRLAVMYVENLADPEDSRRLGKIASNLIATDLAGVPDIHIVPPHRISDAFSNLGYPPDGSPDHGTAARVAGVVNAPWMLMGHILQDHPGLIISFELIDVALDEVIATRRISGAAGESIFDVVDRLTDALRRELDIPESALAADLPVSEKTTSSEEAYRLYLEGLRRQLRFEQHEAFDYFEKSIAADSTFALAYYGLSNSTFLDYSAKIRMIDKSLEYSGALPRRDRMIIKALHAGLHGDYKLEEALYDTLIVECPDDKYVFFRYGGLYYGRKDYKRSLELYNRAIELDPTYADALNRVAYIHYRLGDHIKALLTINKCIEVADPNDPNPYDSRGELLSMMGHLDEAIESMEKALSINPDFVSRDRLARLYSFRGDYEKADSLYSTYLSSEWRWERSVGRNLRSMQFILQGKFKEALHRIDEAIGADMADTLSLELESPEQQYGETKWKYFYKAIVYEELGMLDSALVEIRQSGWWKNHIHARILMKLGDERRADSLLADSKDYFVRTTIAGWIYLLRGESNKAIEELTSGLEFSNPDAVFIARYNLGRCLLETGDFEGAVKILKSAEEYYNVDRIHWPLASIKIHYYLGHAYAESGQIDEAIEQYERFVYLWRDADPVPVSLTDARERIKTLRHDN